MKLPFVSAISNLNNTPISSCGVAIAGNASRPSFTYRFGAFKPPSKTKKQMDAINAARLIGDSQNGPDNFFGRQKLGVNPTLYAALSHNGFRKLENKRTHVRVTALLYKTKEK